MSKEPPETRAQILDAAVELFARKGFAETGMDEIARAVGVSKPAIYHYFTGKEQLFCQLLEDAHAEHLRILADMRAMNLDLHAWVIELIRRALQIMIERPARMLMIVRLYTFPLEIREFEEIRRMDLDLRDNLIDMLKTHLGRYRLRAGVTPDLFVDFFHGIVHAYIVRRLIIGVPADPAATPEALGDMVFYGSFEV